MFDTFVLIVIGYSIFTTLYYVSFSPEKDEYLIIIDDIVLYVFITDFTLNFFVEYQDQETFLYVREHKKIALKYAYSGWMFLDFIATFPIDKIPG